MTNTESYFVRNRETGKLELHFDKADYLSLTDEQKRTVKSNFLWGRASGCWISRCKEPHLSWAIGIAEKLGLTDGGSTGERLSFAEQQEIKAAKAERRAERFEHAADAAEARGAQLQKPIADMHGDIAFFTQPNISTSAGRAFTRRRDRMFAAFEAGIKEFNKSEYYRDRAETARTTAAQKGLQDKGFIARRIAECEKDIRAQKRNLESYEETKQRTENGESLTNYRGEPLTLDAVNGWIERALDRLEATLDKLGYYQDALDALGGVTFSAENVKPGCIVKLSNDHGTEKVLSAGPKFITYQSTDPRLPFVLKASYAEIKEIVSEAKPEEKPESHPFKVGDVFTCRKWNETERRFSPAEYRIIRATEKTVTIQTGTEKPFTRKPSKVLTSRTHEWRLSITEFLDGTVYKEAVIA